MRRMTRSALAVAVLLGIGNYANGAASGSRKNNSNSVNEAQKRNISNHKEPPNKTSTNGSVDNKITVTRPNLDKHIIKLSGLGPTDREISPFLEGILGKQMIIHHKEMVEDNSTVDGKNTTHFVDAYADRNSRLATGRMISARTEFGWIPLEIQVGSGEANRGDDVVFKLGDATFETTDKGIAITLRNEKGEIVYPRPYKQAVTKTKEPEPTQIPEKDPYQGDYF